MSEDQPTQNPTTITYLRFAQYTARLASLAGGWAGDALIEHEAGMDHMRPEVLRRYISDVRRFIDYVDPDGKSS